MRERPAPRRELIINGLPLASDAVGIGVYGRRLVRGLLARRAALTCTPIVVVPKWLAPRFDLETDVMDLWSPRAGHALLDEAIWSHHVGSWARQRGALFFSPAPLWSRFAPEASVIFQHDRIHHFFPRYLGRKGLRRGLINRAEACLGRCRLVVTHSEHGRRDLAAIPGVVADRIRVIRPWLTAEFNRHNAARLAPLVRSKYRLPQRFWLYVGGYDYRKNVELLIAAYARVARGCDAPRLVLAGRLPPRNKRYCDVTAALERSGLSGDRVFCPGFIAGQDMPGLFGGAELLIYPSRYEGFGLPPMEAMGCGCPAIAADTSSLPEVVRDPDYRFGDDDEAGLGALLARAVPERLPLNPSFTREDFSEQVAMDAYVTLFNEVAAT
jgi:glycosyltransferase involved in cell wall biosynthesis